MIHFLNTSQSDDQNLDLDKFLSYTKPRPDLRDLILEYEPLQTPLAYAKEFYPCAVLDSIRKMVGFKMSIYELFYVLPF